MTHICYFTELPLAHQLHHYAFNNWLRLLYTLCEGEDVHWKTTLFKSPSTNYVKS